MNAVKLAEKRPAWGTVIHPRLSSQLMATVAYEDKDCVHIAFPVLSNTLVVFLRLGQVGRPKIGGGIVIAAWLIIRSLFTTAGVIKGKLIVSTTVNSVFQGHTLVHT